MATKSFRRKFKYACIFIWKQLTIPMPLPSRPGAAIKQKQDWEGENCAHPNFASLPQKMMGYIQATEILWTQPSHPISKLHKCYKHQDGAFSPPRTRSASSTLSLCSFPCGSTAWARTVAYRDAGSNMAGMLIDRSASGLEEPGKLVCCQFFLNILNSWRGVFQQTEQESRQR